MAAYKELADRLALDPDNTELLYAVFSAGLDTALAETLSLLKARLAAVPRSSALRLNERHIYALLCERRGRLAAGKPLKNATGLDDLEFQFARSELLDLVRDAQSFLATYYDSEGAATLLAEALVGLGFIDKAEKTFSLLRKHGSGIAAATNFEPAFHSGLESACQRALDALPTVDLVRSGPATNRIIFTSADHIYFERFGWDFIETYRHHQDGGTSLHLHIVDIDAGDRDAVVKRLGDYTNLAWSLTTEWTGLRGRDPEKARGYYHAIRFIRYWQLLMRTDAAICMFDVDTLFQGSTKPLFQLLDEHDLALLLLPSRLEVRNKITACYVGAANTAAARTYLKKVSGYIGAYWNQDRLPWGIDQVAMYATLVMSTPRPDIGAIPEDISDCALKAAKAIPR